MIRPKKPKTASSGSAPLGTVTVGLDASPPVPLHTGLPGEGFEVDLLAAVAERAGFQVRYESDLWERLIERLVEGGLDMICTAATITEERRRIVDFSDPYLDYQLAIVVGRGDNSIRAAADLAGRAIGVRVATTAEDYARRHLRAGRLLPYHFNAEAYSALSEGAVDAVLDDGPIAKGFEARLPALRVVATIAGTEAQYGIMFPRGRAPLREAVNRALRSLRRDGTHQALYRKWFP